MEKRDVFNREVGVLQMLKVRITMIVSSYGGSYIYVNNWYPWCSQDRDPIVAFPIPEI
jgi:hypothetical protein